MAASKKELCLVLFDNDNKKLGKKPPYLSCAVRCPLAKPLNKLANGATLFPRGFFSSSAKERWAGYLFDASAVKRVGGKWVILEFEGIAIRNTKVFVTATKRVETRSAIVNDNTKKEGGYVRFYQ